VSVVVAAAVVAGGIGWLVGRRLVLRRARVLRERVGLPAESAERSRAASQDPFACFPCKVGDVVVRKSEPGEAWLAGALVLSEQGPVAALFIAPEVGGDRALYIEARAKSTVTWLTPLAEGVLAIGVEPPHTIENGGNRFARRRRLPVGVHRVGEHVPAFDGNAIVAEYAGPGAQRIVVLIGKYETLAWQGVALSEGEYDVLSGAEAPEGT
jgi:hypothetical protein